VFEEHTREVDYSDKSVTGKGHMCLNKPNILKCRGNYHWIYLEHANQESGLT
jgi:hypothetical protein